MMTRMVHEAAGGDAYRAIVEGTASYGLFFLDAAGRIQSWNPGCQEIFGYSADEALGQPFAMLYSDADKQEGVPEAELRTAERSGAAVNSRWMMRRDGTTFWAEGTISFVAEPRGFACVIRDASERQKLEQALERATEELHRFTFTVSHDLKEPLRTVTSFTELLERRYKGKLDADADEFLRHITEGVARMSQLLKDILDYSQAGRADRTHPEPAQAANILQWALMNLDGLVKQTGAVITYDALPTVRADQTQLMIVLQQLIGNSIKFRSAEPPRIHISATPAPNGMWEFAVRDNGIGVAPEQTERVFGVFKRLHGRDVPGTGIGLAICRKIIQAHNGRIWMESEPGRGATVRFTLPAG